MLKIMNDLVSIELQLVDLRRHKMVVVVVTTTSTTVNKVSLANEEQYSSSQ
jgi:hypothetical protein